jgi:hypothetical protein
MANGTADQAEREAAWVAIAAMLWGLRLELWLVALPALVLAGLRRPLGIAAAVGVVAAAVVVVVVIGPVRRWLAGSLHASNVRRRWRRAWLRCGLPPVRAGRVVRVPAGDLVSVRVSPGSSFEVMAERAEELAACLRLRELRVDRDRHDASRGTVTLVRRDPLAQLAGMEWPQLEAPRLSLWDPVPLGLDEQGETVEVGLAERNMLLGGEPGAGKSAALSMLIATAALDPTARVWLLDGKLVELAAWAPCPERLVGPDVGDAIELLEAVREAMEDRYRQLLAGGLRKITRELPLHCVVCDELAFYLMAEDRKQRARFSELLRDIVARGRAAGIITLAATQKPSTDVVPSALRDLFGFRLALRCTTPQASDTILGQGWASQGHNTSTIAPGERGVGYLLAEDGLPIRLRTFYLSDKEIARLAARAGELRRRPQLLERAS